MGLFSDVLSGIGGIVGGLGSIYNTKKINSVNREIAGQNVLLQKETNALNEALTRESWQRDDTSYQRKVADLKAAGLNPYLAGSGAGEGNTAFPTMTAPQNNYSPMPVQFSAIEAMINPLARVIELQKAVNESKKTREEARNIEIQNTFAEDNQKISLVSKLLQNYHLEAERKNIDSQTKYTEKNIDKIDSEIYYLRAQVSNLKSQKNYNYAKVKEIDDKISARVLEKQKLMGDLDIQEKTLEKLDKVIKGLGYENSVKRFADKTKEERWRHEKAMNYLNFGENVLGDLIKLPFAFLFTRRRS